MGPDGARGRFALIDAGACVGAEWLGHGADDGAGAEMGTEASVGRGDSAGSVLAQGRDEHNVGANAKTRAWTSRHGRECQAAQAPSMEVRRRGRRYARPDKERRKETNAWPSG